MKQVTWITFFNLNSLVRIKNSLSQSDAAKLVYCTYRHVVYECCQGLISGVPDSLPPNLVHGLWHHGGEQFQSQFPFGICRLTIFEISV